MNNDCPPSSLRNLTLGKKTDYCSTYSPELLQAVPRAFNREELGVVTEQPFVGVDIWNAYELSWLNLKGKPVVALARLKISAKSPNIIESKSLKLYLNSYNQTRFDSIEFVQNQLKDDLSGTAGMSIQVELFSASEINMFGLSQLPGVCLDELNIDVEQYTISPELLTCESQNNEVEETVHSHLLKSNCLITNQPDWASVVIGYSGQKIDHHSLLKYLISFRMHNEFHEQCVERIFMDIYKNCNPNALWVQALYTRRGGLDINPCRHFGEIEKMPLFRINRQ